MNAALLAMVATVNLSFEAPPIVSEFFDSNAPVRVIHGPVGSGKSSGCVMEILRRAVEQTPDANNIRDTRWAVVRNTYRELEDTTRRTFEQWLGPIGKWREKDFAFDIDRPLPDGTRLKVEVLFRALDKPADVKKLLSLEITGAYINELRELPKAILDGLSMRVGRYPAMKDGGATWDGIWADTNPWAEGSEYAEMFASAPEGYRLFRQPSGLAPNAENKANLKPRYYEQMSAGKSQDWIDEYVHGKNPRSDKGSIYGEYLTTLRERGGVSRFEHPMDGVFAVFDLGVSDSTAIWWFRIRNGLPDVIDWFEFSGKGSQFYFDVLDGKVPQGVDRARAYDIKRIFLPHDAKQRTFQTGVSTLDQFLEKYPNRVGLAPELDVAAGIDAGRWLLEQPLRIHARCEEGLKRLKSYRFEFDEEKKVFKKTPLHDFASHSADAWRYTASVAKAIARLMKPEEKPAAKPIGPLRPTLNQLLEENGLSDV